MAKPESPKKKVDPRNARSLVEADALRPGGTFVDGKQVAVTASRPAKDKADRGGKEV